MRTMKVVIVGLAWAVLAYPGGSALAGASDPQAVSPEKESTDAGEVRKKLADILRRLGDDSWDVREKSLV